MSFDWDGLAADLLKVMGTCVLTVMPGSLIWAAMVDADRRAEWDAWCLARGGEIVDHQRIPPDLVGPVVGARYCLVDTKVVGSR